jgi:hypothetical protein
MADRRSDYSARFDSRTRAFRFTAAQLYQTEKFGSQAVTQHAANLRDGQRPTMTNRTEIKQPFALAERDDRQEQTGFL